MSLAMPSFAPPALPHFSVVVIYDGPMMNFELRGPAGRHGNGDLGAVLSCKWNASTNEDEQRADSFYDVEG